MNMFGSGLKLRCWHVRDFGRRSIFLLVAFILCLSLSVVREEKNEGKVYLGSDCVEGSLYNFSVPNDDDKVDELSYVCVESAPKAVFIHANYNPLLYNKWHIADKVYKIPRTGCDLPAKKVSSYDSKYRLSFLRFHGFQIHFTSGVIPKDFTLSNETAFFMGQNDLPFEPENLFHFIKQFFIPLHFMMSSTNNLNSESNNVLFYPLPLGRCPSNFKRFNVDYAKPYFDLLKIADPYTSVYEDSVKPHKVCYKRAYFSSARHLNRARDAIKYIKESFGVTKTACNSSSKLLTFIARKGYRRVINKDELIKVAKSMGYETRIAHLETMSQPEQAQLMQCTDVLVGVAGAGLQWAYFMKRFSGVIEIAWPQYQWPFFFSSLDWTGPSDSTYTEMNAVIPLSFAQLVANKCHLNPEAIRIYHKSIFKVESPLTNEEALKILSDPRNNHFDTDKMSSTGKFCDVDVDPEKFREALMRIDACNAKKGREWK